jgi:hypothetical protein
MFLLHIAREGKYDFTLKMPLVFAAVLELVYQLGEPILEELAEGTKMNLSQVEFLVKRAVGKDFALLKLTPAPEKGKGTVSFNPAFEMKKKRLAVVVPAKFSLRPPPKAGAAPAPVRPGVVRAPATGPAAPAPVAPPAPTSGDATMFRYQSQIVRIIKNIKKMEANRLATLVEKEVASTHPFNRVDYDKAITYLEQQKFIQRDPKKPGLFLYVSEEKDGGTK